MDPASLFLAAIIADAVINQGRIIAQGVSNTGIAVNRVYNALRGLPQSYQLEQTREKFIANGATEEVADRVIEEAQKRFRTANLIDYGTKVVNVITRDYGPEGKAAAESVVREIAAAIDETIRRDAIGNIPVAGLISGPIQANMSRLTDAPGQFALRGQSPGDVFLNNWMNGASTNPYSVPIPGAAEFVSNSLAQATQALTNVWEWANNVAYQTKVAVVVGASVFAAYKFYQLYRSKSVSDDEFQQRVDRAVAKRLPGSSHSTSKSVTKSASDSKSGPPGKSVARKVTYTERGEEIKIPDETESSDSETDWDAIVANYPTEATPQFEKASLVVDAFVTIFVSRALFFAIPEDPPQSIWSYVKSYFRPQFSHLLHMVFTEPQDADKRNPISRCFVNSIHWSSVERKRYAYLLDLKQRHVSVGAKVKAVLDNKEYLAGTLLDYIAKHRKTIVSQGFFETLATFPLFLQEFFRGHLEQYADAIRKRDQAILANRPIVEKPELPELLWNNRDIDLLFLLDERRSYTPNLFLDHDLDRYELYELAKKPRRLQDYLFKARRDYGISSRLEVKTGEHTVIVYKPGSVNPSIWGIMEKQKPNHYERHLKAAFLLAAAELENEMMEEHFCWKDGPYKRYIEQKHKEDYRKWKNMSPRIEFRSVLDAKWFEEVTWFSGVATAASEKDAVKMLVSKPPPQFSKLQADENRIHGILGGREVTITVTDSYEAKNAYNVMKAMGQFSFGREPHLDTFIYGQFDIGEWAVLVHYRRSKSLFNHPQYATDRSLCKAILAIGEAHRYNYGVRPTKDCIRVDPETGTVFLELFGVSRLAGPDFEFRDFLKAWLSIKDDHELAKKLLERQDVLESVKGCTLVSKVDHAAGPVYESETGLRRLNVWLTELQGMHRKGFYGFITPKLLDSGNLHENKTLQEDGIPDNIDHRGLIKQREWSIHLDCKMLLESVALLSRYRQDGTWNEHGLLLDFDLVTIGYKTDNLTTDLLIESLLLTLQFLGDVPDLRWYLEASIRRETLFTYRVLTQPKNWFYDIKERVLYKKKGEDVIPISELKTCKLSRKEWQDNWLRK